jgi:hypothetical protein
MRNNECVQDQTVIARLPKSTWVWQWQWKTWRTVGGWRPLTARTANAKLYWLGPLFVCRPMPWLLGPARALHPEAFDGQARDGVKVSAVEA